MTAAAEYGAMTAQAIRDTVRGLARLCSSDELRLEAHRAVQRRDRPRVPRTVNQIVADVIAADEWDRQAAELTQETT